VNGDDQTRVVGLLGVGFDHEDRHIRITQSGQYRVIMGSGETHAELQKICGRINEKVKSTGRRLEEFSPEEFMNLVRELY
jgi:hypothetical protein